MSTLKNGAVAARDYVEAKISAHPRVTWIAGLSLLALALVV